MCVGPLPVALFRGRWSKSLYYTPWGGEALLNIRITWMPVDLCRATKGTHHGRCSSLNADDFDRHETCHEIFNRQKVTVSVWRKKKFFFFIIIIYIYMKRKTPPPNIIIISIYDEEIMKIRPTVPPLSLYPSEPNSHARRRDCERLFFFFFFH